MAYTPNLSTYLRACVCNWATIFGLWKRFCHVIYIQLNPGTNKSARKNSQNKRVYQLSINHFAVNFIDSHTLRIKEPKTYYFNRPNETKRKQQKSIKWCRYPKGVCYTGKGTEKRHSGTRVFWNEEPSIVHMFIFIVRIWACILYVYMCHRIMRMATFHSCTLLLFHIIDCFLTKFLLAGAFRFHNVKLDLDE